MPAGSSSVQRMREALVSGDRHVLTDPIMMRGDDYYHNEIVTRRVVLPSFLSHNKCS